MSHRSPAAMGLMLSLGLAAPASALASNDSDGRQWRPLLQTEGFSWLEVAAICPTDGKTPCQGSLDGTDFGGWVWATKQQVIKLFNASLPPGKGLSEGLPQRLGIEQLAAVEAFLANVLAPTHSFCINYACGAGVIGYTASSAGKDRVFVGSAVWHRTPVSIEAGFSIANLSEADVKLPDHGVWMWREPGVTAAVPEPSTFGLMALGSLGLVAVAARRRRRITSKS